MTPRSEALVLRVGLCALVAFAPLIDGGATYLPATIVRLAALVLALFWLWQAAGPEGSWRRATPVDLPVLVFVVLAAGSTLASVYPYLSLQAFLGLSTGALTLAVAAEVSREAKGVRAIAGVVLLGSVVQALLALWQVTMGGANRPAGTYFNPNHLALAVAIAGALLLAARPAAGLPTWCAVAAVGLVGSALLATASRGGLVAALAGWGLVAWRRWRWRAMAGAGLLALGLLVVPNPLASRLARLDAGDPLAYARVRIWQSAVERGLDHPFGVGLGLFRQSSQRYAFPIEADVARYGRRAESAHNEYLQVFAELGPAGLAVALWALWVLALGARRALRSPDPDGTGPLSLGAAGALTAVAVHASVETLLDVPGLVVQSAALAGLLLRSSPAPAVVPGPPRLGAVTRRRLRLAGVALGVVAALGVGRYGLAYAARQRADAEWRASGPEAAIRWLERAASLAPGNAGYMDGLAEAAFAAWTRSSAPAHAVLAEQSMLRAMALDPGDARRPARLARIYQEIVPADPALRRRALERARALHGEAARLDPYSAEIAFERAKVLVLLEDEEGAIASLERAVALEPRFLPARLTLARMRAARGERAAAAAHYGAIEATLTAYRGPRARGPYVREFLAVDRAAVLREAAALAEGAS